MHPRLIAFDGFTPLLTTVLPTGLAASSISALLGQRRASSAGAAVPVLDGTLVFVVLSVGFLVRTPQPRPPRDVELELGNDLGTALAASGDDWMPWLQLGGNLVMLAPLGALVPVRVRWFAHVRTVVLGGFALSCVIETVQFFLIPGRVASLDDVVLNTVGTAFGAGAAFASGWLRGSFGARRRRAVDVRERAVVYLGGADRERVASRTWEEARPFRPCGSGWPLHQCRGEPTSRGRSGRPASAAAGTGREVSPLRSR